MARFAKESCKYFRYKSGVIMSMLARYYKQGGFQQLLLLVEGCVPKKQEQLLGILQTENINWYNAIKAKILTLDRVFTWNDEILAEIASRIKPLTLAVALHGLSEERWARLSKTLSQVQKRAILEMKELQKPTPIEVASAYAKIVEEVRGIFAQGILKMEKVDLELVVPRDIEEQLKNKASNSNKLVSSDQATPLKVENSSTEKVSKSNLAGASETPAMVSESVYNYFDDEPTAKTNLNEIRESNQTALLESLRKEIQSLKQQNAALLVENKSLKEKLGKLKSIVGG